MKISIDHRLLHVLWAGLATIALIVGAQQVGAQTSDNSKYFLFIHAGPLEPNDERVRSIAYALVERGYSVRAPDRDVDFVGGPGVDYFDDGAKAKAEDVANIVNEEIEKMVQSRRIEGSSIRKLVARRQNVKNPAVYLGVWLFPGGRSNCAAMPNGARCGINAFCSAGNCILK